MINTRIIYIDPRELKLLKDNARFMKHEQYHQLVENIKRDGQLTSAPFAWLDRSDGKYEVLSGNHRVMAAIEAEIPEIPCIVTDDELDEDQRIGIQLSHNAIVGEDDPETLRRLYDKILNIDMKKYSGLDDKTLELLDKASTQAMTEANMEFQTLSIVYLPNELKAAQKIIDTAIQMAGNTDAIWIAKEKEYDRWLDNQETAMAAHNVKNVSAGLRVIFDVFEHNLDQLAEGWYQKEKNDSQWVPFSTVIGRQKIPAKSAKVIRAALDRMRGHGEIEINALWEGLERLCQKYLEG